MKITHIYGVIQTLLLEKGILNEDFTINESKTKPILKNLKTGLKQYLCIQRSVYLTNVGKDILFQEVFSNFYRIDPFKDKKWKKEFYTLLEASKHKKVNFENILTVLHKKTGDIDASFSSKLVATINPEMPVIDSVVLQNLRLNTEYQEICREPDVPRRMERTTALRQKLIKWFNVFLRTKGGRNLIKRFISEYPYANITKTKMFDLILWQIRR